jgi:hypothetical protein
MSVIGSAIEFLDDKPHTAKSAVTPALDQLGEASATGSLSYFDATEGWDKARPEGVGYQAPINLERKLVKIKSTNKNVSKPKRLVKKTMNKKTDKPMTLITKPTATLTSTATLLAARPLVPLSSTVTPLVTQPLVPLPPFKHQLTDKPSVILNRIFNKPTEKEEEEELADVRTCSYETIQLFRENPSHPMFCSYPNSSLTIEPFVGNVLPDLNCSDSNSPIVISDDCSSQKKFRCDLCNLNFDSSYLLNDHDNSKSHIKKVYDKTIKINVGIYDLSNEEYSDLVGSGWISNSIIESYLSVSLQKFNCLIVNSETVANILNNPLNNQTALFDLSKSDINKYDFLVGVELVDSKKHWVSFVVNLKKAQFSVVCPYGLKRRTQIQSDFYSVRFESWCEYYNSRKDCERKQWEMIHYQHDHQNQKDGFNCGVFCSFYIEEIVKSNQIYQQPKHLGLFRKEMANILTSNSSI